MGVEPKIGGKPTPKMDGENFMKNHLLKQMDDLGVPWGTPIFRNINIFRTNLPFLVL